MIVPAARFGHAAALQALTPLVEAVEDDILLRELLHIAADFSGGSQRQCHHVTRRCIGRPSGSHIFCRTSDGRTTARVPGRGRGARIHLLDVPGRSRVCDLRSGSHRPRDSIILSENHPGLYLDDVGDLIRCSRKTHQMSSKRSNGTPRSCIKHVVSQDFAHDAPK